MLGPAIRLKSTRLHLRHAQPADIPQILAYYTTHQAYLTPFEPLKPSTFYTAKYWERELQNRIDNTKAEQSLKLFLFTQQNPKAVIGTLNFSNFVRGVFQSCTVGYSLAENYQGHGYMYEAMIVAIEHIFLTMQFHRISANYLPHNQRSGRLLKRLGFTVEGYARDYLYINGHWQDHILTSLINPHFKD
ncbi:MAG: GNAT family N-acetyltransferase [Cyanobacteria bacterium J06598_1]